MKPRGRKLSNDAPKGSHRDDTYGRKDFARQIATEIRAWDGKDSLTVGLSGPWGSGKTTLKNFVCEAINYRRISRKIRILDFNPWQFSGRRTVTEAFFGELETLFSEEKVIEKAQIRALSSRLTASATFGKGFAKLMQLAALPAAAIDPDAAATLAAIGGASEKTAEAIEGAADVAKVDDANTNLSLSDLKKKIASNLADLNDPVLIVIDDIDRLTEEEIREVFQLVRINADFPNLVYLLLFDRDVVSSALNPISGGRGDEFLEKITPIIYEVPKAREKVLLQQLSDEVNKLLGELGCDNAWLNSRFHELWNSGVRTYFQNPRDVNRFMNGLSSFWTLMTEDSIPELDLVEMFVLEAIRLFDREFYASLHACEELLTTGRTSRFYLSKEEATDAEDRQIQEIANKSKIGDKRLALNLIEHLFPATGKHAGGHNDVWLEERRVGHKAFFNRYFSRNISNEEVRATDITSLIMCLKKGESISTAIPKWDQRGISNDLLRELLVHIDSFSQDELRVALNTLSLDCDLFTIRDRKEAFGEIGITYLVGSIISKIFRKLPENSREDILLKALENSSGFSLPLELFWKESEHIPAYEASEGFREKIRSIARNKIRACASKGFPENHDLGPIMLGWKMLEGGDPSNPREWLSTQLVDSEKALKVLKCFIGICHIGTNHRSKRRYSVYGGADELLDFERVNELTKGIKLDDIDADDDRRAIRALRYHFEQGNERSFRDENDPLTENV